MTNIRLPLEHFTRLRPMPPALDNELHALWLLRSGPSAHMTKHLMLPERVDPFIYIRRVFRSGMTSESFVILDEDLADTLRFWTVAEPGFPSVRSLSSVGATHYEELVYNAVQEIAKPVLRDVGFRETIRKYETVLEAVVPALAMPHRQVVYLQAPTQLRLTAESGESWFVTLDGKVLNPSVSAL